MKKIAKIKIKTALWQIIDVIACILPLILYTSFNLTKYFKVINDSTKFQNIFGIVILLVFLIVLLTKKEILKGILGIWIVVGVFYAIRFMVSDIVSISFWCAVGLTISKFITKPIYNNVKQVNDAKIQAIVNGEITSEINKEMTNRIVEAINGRG